MPELKEMRKRKVERMNQFVEVLDKMYNISKELYTSDKEFSDIKGIDESDLSLKRLEGLQSQLHDLEKEKVNALFHLQVYLGKWNGYLKHRQTCMLRGSFCLGRFSMSFIVDVEMSLKLKHIMDQS